MDNNNYFSFSGDSKYKIVIIGDVNVGKSSIFWRFTEDYFMEEKDEVTTIDFKMKNINIENQMIKLYIWDTAGQQKYRSIVSTYFQGCQGIILVFDLTNPLSFHNIQKVWMKICQQKCVNVQYILVGNKSDLSKQIGSDIILQFAKNNNLLYFQTSVKTNSNINQAFLTLAKNILAKKIKRKQLRTSKLESVDEKKTKKCC